MLSEAAIQSHARAHGAQHGYMLWRNNNGASYDKNGRLIRYGLGNDSAQVNAKFKSPDLVGIKHVIVTPDMVGKPIGMFVGWEVKAEGWTFRQSDDRAVAQQRFGNIIENWGGEFRFISSIEGMFT